MVVVYRSLAGARAAAFVETLRKAGIEAVALNDPNPSHTLELASAFRYTIQIAVHCDNAERARQIAVKYERDNKSRIDSSLNDLAASASKAAIATAIYTPICVFAIALGSPIEDPLTVTSNGIVTALFSFLGFLILFAHGFRLWFWTVVAGIGLLAPFLLAAESLATGFQWNKLLVSILLRVALMIAIALFAILFMRSLRRRQYQNASVAQDSGDDQAEMKTPIPFYKRMMMRLTMISTAHSFEWPEQIAVVSEPAADDREKTADD